MTENDALKYELEQSRNAFNNLHKDYIKLLKQQGEIERENEQLRQSIDNMGGRLQGLWANYYENRWGVWSEAVEDVARELGFKIHTIYDDPISDSDSKKERVNGVKKINEIMCENKQLKERIKELEKEVSSLSYGEADWLIEEML